jgi:hypothetical protein
VTARGAATGSRRENVVVSWIEIMAGIAILFNASLYSSKNGIYGLGRSMSVNEFRSVLEGGLPSGRELFS